MENHSWQGNRYREAQILAFNSAPARLQNELANNPQFWHLPSLPESDRTSATAFSSSPSPQRQEAAFSIRRI